MAKFRHISTKLVLALDAGQADGKKVTKRVTISNIREDASADALWELAEALGKLLVYPVAQVRLYKVEELEREAGDREAETGGETDTEAAATAGTQVNDDVAARDGLRHGGYAAARVFGGVGQNGQLSRPFNDGYAGKRYCCAITAASAGQYTLIPSLRGAEGDAAIQDLTRPGYTRPPP